MATYVNDLRLKEIATGDESGTWGTSTNTNLELIGEALSYGTQESFSSDANVTTTVADGSTDPARAFYFKVTSSGSLTATRVLTIAPNTVSRIQIIENATSGSQIITIKQGSGATVNIPNGETRMVYMDGAGSGAAVVDALADINIGGKVTVGVDDTGYDVKLFGATSGKYWLWDESADGVLQYSSLTVGVDNTGYDVKFFGATSGAYMLWDESADDLKLVGAAGLTVAGDIDIDGTANLDAVDIDGAVQLDSTFTVGANDTGYDVKFFGATASAYMLWDESADDLVLAGAAGLDIAGDIDVDGTTNLDAVDIDGALTQDGGAVFNEDSADVDFRIESDDNANMFFVDGGNDKVGIGTGSPDQTVHVMKASAGTIDSDNNAVITIENDDTAVLQILCPEANNGYILFGNPNDGSTDGRIRYNNSTREMSLWTAGTERLTVDSSGNVGIGTTSPSTELHVDGAITSNDLFLNNEGKDPNMFDGTNGSWQIQEGSDDLFIMNKITGKKYKFKLEEI